MKVIAKTVVAVVVIGFVSAQAGEDADKKELRLPAPLDAVACDFGVLEKHLHVADAKFYLTGEFTAGNRVVAEETIVWTLEAKEALSAKEVFDLLHPNPAPGPFYKVRFSKTVEGKDVPADARAKGYSLIGDLRWIGPKTGPDLAKGDKLQVWVHLGNEGSTGLIAQKATRLTVAAK
jgi:hypothetical protein